MKRFIKTLVLTFVLASAGSVRAERWLLQNDDLSFGGIQDLFIFVMFNGGTPLFDLFYPEEGFVAILADFPPGSPPALPAVGINGGTITGELDIQLGPDAGGGGGGSSSWAVASLTTGASPVSPAPGFTKPTIYLPDTGVTLTHSDLIGSTLNFLPGIAAAYDYNVDPLGLPLPPTPDSASHGTAMASVIGGETCGILCPLQIQTNIVPVSIYDRLPSGNPDTNTWASTVLNAMLKIITDHRLRIAETPYTRNHASLVCFAHSTVGTAYRIGFLDTVMQRAWDAGITVVLSAGNRGILAGRVSPAAADWGYQPASGGPVYPPFTGNPTTTFVRDSTTLPIPLLPRFLVAGASSLGGTAWSSSNTNNASGKVVDLLAPGVNVLAASNGGTSLIEGNGTSYSAGFVTAASALIAYTKPWATPDQIRAALVPQSVPEPPAPPPALTLPQIASPAISGITMTYAEWIAHYTKGISSPLTGAGGDATADPDGDSIPNLIEYYCGLDPKYSDTPSGPQISMDMTTRTLTLQLPRAIYLPTGTPPPQLQTSTTLESSSWTDVTPVLTETQPVIEIGDGTEYTGTLTIPTGDRRFYRVAYPVP